MKWKVQLLLLTLALPAALALGDEPSNPASPRHITLYDAVQLALHHNHNIRIAEYTVEEKQHAKEVAKSAYFPNIRNESTFEHVTDTQLIESHAGRLGKVAGRPIPPGNLNIKQGWVNLTNSGNQATQ